MIGAPSWILWLVAGGTLVLLDRFLKTGLVLTALGLACIGGAITALASVPFEVESFVAVTLAGLSSIQQFSVLAPSNWHKFQKPRIQISNILLSYSVGLRRLWSSYFTLCLQRWSFALP